jgi:hypothetical protein
MEDFNSTEKAGEIFKESLLSMMAHSIRATQNVFKKAQLTLDLVILADTRNILKLKAPPEGPTSILRSQMPLGEPPCPGCARRVKATIHLHKYCCKNLARICIAHELCHLLMELEQYKRAGGGAWAPVPPTSNSEELCNLFAFELCAQHDAFNKNDESRRSNIYFPDGLLDAMRTSRSVGGPWPRELGLDPEKPFYRRPDAGASPQN